jgi:hypothetical protein
MMSAASLMLSLTIAASTLHGQRERTSADLMLKFDHDLSTGNDDALVNAIENGDKILKRNGGQFTESNLDELLGEYELVADTSDAGLITDRMIFDAFSYDLCQVYKNREVAEYVSESQRSDPTFYVGFQKLARRFDTMRSEPEP